MNAARTRSSTKTFPFFLPLGFSTPTGVTMFNSGMPSSLSVYTFFFFFFKRSLAIWPGRTGGFLPSFVFLALTTGSLSGRCADLLFLMPEFLAACLFLTVFVRATPIFSGLFRGGLAERVVCLVLFLSTEAETLSRRQMRRRLWKLFLGAG